MKPKVIIITTNLPPENIINPNTQYFKDGKYRIECFRRGYGWGYNFGKNLAKFAPEIEVECWNIYAPEKYYDLGVCQRFANGMHCIQFPTKRVYNKDISFLLFKELKRRIKNGEKIIVHAHNNLYSIQSMFLSMICRETTPFVVQERGPSSPPLWRYIFKKNPLYLIQALINEFNWKHVDHVFASPIASFKYVGRKIGRENTTHIKGGGFDFEKYKETTKYEARQSLSLPLDKTLLLHAGRFMVSGGDKGLSVLIDIYDELITKYPDIQLVFVGGDKNQELYDELVASGAIVRGFVSPEEFMKYVNACDIQVYPSPDRMWRPFGDITTAMVESLCLNRPVISPLLIHFMGTKDERRKLGIMTLKKKQFFKAIDIIMNNYDFFSNSRHIMEKYYSWENIIRMNVDVYNALFNRYYGIDTG